MLFSMIFSTSTPSVLILEPLIDNAIHLAHGRKLKCQVIEVVSYVRDLPRTQFTR